MRIAAQRNYHSDTYACLNELGKPLALLVLCALFTGIFFGSNKNVVGSVTSDSFSCAANGNAVFPWQPLRNQDWAADSILSVTIGFGKFTFSEAKALDICWGGIVGKGGQFLLSWLAYRVIRRSLVMCMEKRLMHIPVVMSLTFEHASIQSIWKVLRDILSRWNWRLAAFLQILTYVLTFSTLVSAMTAYQAQLQPWFSESSSGHLVPARDIEIIKSVVVRDGQRVGLAPFQTFYSNQSDEYTALLEYAQAANESRPAILDDHPDQASGTTSGPGFTLDWIRSSAIRSSTGVTYINSTIVIGNATHHISAPPLNIITGDQWYLYSGSYLNKTWLESNTTCQPLGTYQWGFSSQLLFLFCIMTILFACSLLAMSWEVWMRSHADRYRQRFSIYRDILDLAAEITCELGGVSSSMAPAALDKALPARSGGIRVEIEELPLSRMEELDGKFSLECDGQNEKGYNSCSGAFISRSISRVDACR